MNMFRTLRADEIDCRIAQIKKDGSGLSLLLYKDARCDQNILDETVGAFFWQRSHSRENANCTVSIWDESHQRWVSKEDTGTESNTEKEKGLASDSFKRACFNWGIGRELYTAPFIWITKDKCNMENKDGRVYCNDRFTVHGIGYTDGVITGLEIKNQKTGKICFKYGEIKETAPDKPEQPENDQEKQEAPKEFTPPPASTGADVSTGNTLPPVQKEAEPKPQPNAVQLYLMSQMKMLREMRQISFKENNKLFEDQLKALIGAGLAPNKKTSEYTMQEAESLIDAMIKNFPPKSAVMNQK